MQGWSRRGVVDGGDIGASYGIHIIHVQAPRSKHLAVPHVELYESGHRERGRGAKFDAAESASIPAAALEVGVDTLKALPPRQGLPQGDGVGNPGTC